jgi:hypothetical protein
MGYSVAQVTRWWERYRAAGLDELKQFWEHPTVLLHLTGYPWWVQALPPNISSFP